MAPSASRSLAAQTAVNGVSPASSASMPSAPPSWLKPVLTTSRSSYAMPGLGEAAPVALLPAERHVQRGRAGEECDAAMAQLHQGGDHPRDPGGIVHADVGVPCGMWREMHDGRAIRAHGGHVPGHLRVEHRIGQAAARKDERRGAHRSEQAHVRELTLRDPVRAAGDDQETADRGRVLDAAHDLGEVRVGDVVDDDADDRHVALVQPAGQRVRDVVERPSRLQHPRARARADGVRRGRDDPRDRGRGDPGQPGDVGDGCHVDRAQNGNVGGSSRTVTHCHSVKLSRLASPP